MSSTPTCPTYAVAAELEKVRAWPIALKMVLLYMFLPAFGDAIGEMNAIANLEQPAALRSLRFPALGESPPNCLPPNSHFGRDGECAYILRGPPENGSAGSYQGGILIGSRFPGISPASRYSTMEIAVVLGEQAQCHPWFRGCTPKDVGVYVDGLTLMRLELKEGGTLDLIFSYPRFTKTGGYDYHGDSKAINFSVNMQTKLTVPHVGLIIEAKASTLGEAVVVVSDAAEHAGLGYIDVYAHTSTPGAPVLAEVALDSRMRYRILNLGAWEALFKVHVSVKGVFGGTRVDYTDTVTLTRKVIVIH
ncbi:hypothetical protein FOZ60_009620 [Perkinsus olseni]|uniref:Uncharacterized protein n=2 Tax=Perkinsus olseni TaxID=32597 RepID=A0A7J6PDM9_PEROL|nr:hypothetical protein FOZ60_009620 [Perkinsus olseni]